jgi:hypothetical protein
MSGAFINSTLSFLARVSSGATLVDSEGHAEILPPDVQVVQLYILGFTVLYITIFDFINTLDLACILPILHQINVWQ